MVVEAVSVETIGITERVSDPVLETEENPVFSPVSTVQMYSYGEFHETPVFQRDELKPGACISGPAVLIEKNTTIIIEPGWEGEITERNHLFLKRKIPLPARTAIGTDADPVMLEIFNNRFMSVAEQMGYTLQNTASLGKHKGEAGLLLCHFRQAGKPDSKCSSYPCAPGFNGRMRKIPYPDTVKGNVCRGCIPDQFPVPWRNSSP